MSRAKRYGWLVLVLIAAGSTACDRKAAAPALTWGSPRADGTYLITYRVTAKGPDFSALDPLDLEYITADGRLQKETAVANPWSLDVTVKAADLPNSFQLLVHDPLPLHIAPDVTCQISVNGKIFAGTTGPGVAYCSTSRTLVGKH